MAHWEHREEPGWKDFKFNQPYEKGLKRLKEEVLAKTDFDPATLWQWGTMQAMAVITILKKCEAAFGEDGQNVVYEALHEVGYDIGRQMVEGTEVPEGMGESEYVSYFATVINRIAYASLEEPKIDNENKATFDIVWCPHQDMYGAFDCRVQRYFVMGMIDAARDFVGQFGFDVRFDTTIPSGAHTCHFTMWRPDGDEAHAWPDFTEVVNKKALEHASKAREATEK